MSKSAFILLIALLGIACVACKPTQLNREEKAMIEEELLMELEAWSVSGLWIATQKKYCKAKSYAKYKAKQAWCVGKKEGDEEKACVEAAKKVKAEEDGICAEIGTCKGTYHYQARKVLNKIIEAGKYKGAALAYIKKFSNEWAESNIKEKCTKKEEEKKEKDEKETDEEEEEDDEILQLWGWWNRLKEKARELKRKAAIKICIATAWTKCNSGVVFCKNKYKGKQELFCIKYYQNIKIASKILCYKPKKSKTYKNVSQYIRTVKACDTKFPKQAKGIQKCLTDAFNKIPKRQQRLFKLKRYQ